MRDRLDAALADLAVHIAYPQVGDLAGPVVARLVAGEVPRTEVRRRRVQVAAAAAVVGAVLALPAPRQAIADWLGVGAVRITVTERVPEAVGTELRLGRAVSLDEARELAGFPVQMAQGLGAPAQVFVGEPSARSVSLVWGAAEHLPAVAGTGVGLLLTEIPGSIEPDALDKRVAPDSVIERVTVDGHPGYWIAGARHVLSYRDSAGNLRDDTTRLAANTLVWSDGSVTYRLESELDRATALRVAEHLVPLD